MRFDHSDSTSSTPSRLAKPSGSASMKLNQNDPIPRSSQLLRPSTQKAPSPTTSKQNHVHSHHADHSDHASEESQASRQLHLDHAKSRQAHLDHAKARQFLLNVADGPSSLQALDAPMGGGASLARPPLSLLLLSSLLIVESVLFESETAIGQGAGQQRLRNLGPLSTCGFFALSVAPACEGCLLR